MGKTYNSQKSSRFEDDTPSGRSGKHRKHTNGKKTGGMRTLNSYVEEDYDFEDDVFEEEIEVSDEITIQHTNTSKY